jgi:hypothetical protein
MNRLAALRDKYERLSQRERLMVGALGVSFVVMLVLVAGFVIADGLSSIEERNADMRQALRDIDTKRDVYLRAKAKTSQIEARMGHTPIQLAGYLEQAAKESGIEIPESSEQPAVAAGKHYVEHAIELHLRQVKLDALAKFLKRVETGPNLVVVTGINLKTRDDKHQELDADLKISTYEHAPEKKEKKGDKS